jgi:hypothetical protein
MPIKSCRNGANLGPVDGLIQPGSSEFCGVIQGKTKSVAKSTPTWFGLGKKTTIYRPDGTFEVWETNPFQPKGRKTQTGQYKPEDIPAPKNPVTPVRPTPKRNPFEDQEDKLTHS